MQFLDRGYWRWYKFSGLFCLVIRVGATFMLDFPWSMSCVVELCAISRLAPGGLVAAISLVRKFLGLDAQFGANADFEATYQTQFTHGTSGLDLHF